MAKRYCRVHPGVAVNWLGECPRCASENQSKRIQAKLVEEQQVTNQLMQQAHAENRALQQKLISEQEATRTLLQRQEAEQNSQREREKIQVGILEFEDDFQEEWNHVAKRFKQLNSKKEEVDAIIDSKLSKEFTRDFKEENLPEIVTQEANTIVDVGSYLDKIIEYDEVISKHSNKLEEDIKHNCSANSLGNIIAQYINRKAYTNGVTPGGGGAGAMYFFASICLIATITSVSGNDGANSSAAITFGVLGFLFLLIGLMLSGSRRKAIEKQRRLDETFNAIASILSPRFLGKDWKFSDEVLGHNYKNLDSLLRVAFYSIKDAHRMPYYNEMISENSPSSSGREVYSVITGSGDLTGGYYDFLNMYGEYESKHSYMRDAIIEVGDDIQNGHRVPSSMKKRRIALMKCPSCGGPLAADSSKTCHYCGSSFERY